MIPWVKLGTAILLDGVVMSLLRRGDEFSIEVDDLVLMNSRSHHSEEQLARLGCAHCAGQQRQHVLVGGLGMGFTLRAALDDLAPDATVTVAELVPDVVAWNREWLAPLARSPLDDPRTRVIVGDVAALIGGATAAYDAILLDVDNGPVEFTTSTNGWLYAKGGIDSAFRALRVRGVLALWSSGDDGGFTSRLRRAGFCATKQRVRARERSGPAHTLWIASKTSDR